MENTASLKIDGYGLLSDTMLSASNNETPLAIINYPATIGLFHMAFAQFIGIPIKQKPGYFIGVASEGVPMYYEKLLETISIEEQGLYKLNKKYFNLSATLNKADNNAHLSLTPLYSKYLTKYFGPPRNASEPLLTRHKDLAASVHKIYEEVVFHCLGHLFAITASDKVIIKSPINTDPGLMKLIRENGPFQEVIFF